MRFGPSCATPNSALPNFVVVLWPRVDARIPCSHQEAPERIVGGLAAAVAVLHEPIEHRYCSANGISPEEVDETEIRKSRTGRHIKPLRASTIRGRRAELQAAARMAVKIGIAIEKLDSLRALLKPKVTERILDMPF
jgi:hypothetical protein